MNINKYIFNFRVKNDDENIFATNYQRSLAGLIDGFIVLFIRGVFLQIIGSLWFINVIKNFLADFKEKFGTETPKGTPEHLEFIRNHSILFDSFVLILAIFLIGLIYHAYFNSSNWQATIGKRILKIAIVNKNGLKISFMDGAYHYLLSTTPFIYVIVLLVFMQKNKYSIFDTLASNHVLLLSGFLILVGTHMGNFNKRKINVFDYLMDVEFHKIRTKNKFPWK